MKHLLIISLVLVTHVIQKGCAVSSAEDDLERTVIKAKENEMGEGEKKNQEFIPKYGLSEKEEEKQPFPSNFEKKNVMALMKRWKAETPHRIKNHNEHADEDRLMLDGEKRNRFYAMMRNRENKNYPKRIKTAEPFADSLENQEEKRPSDVFTDDDENEQSEKRNRFYAMMRNRERNYPKRVQTGKAFAADEGENEQFEKRNRFYAMMRNRERNYPKRTEASEASVGDEDEQLEKRNRYYAMMRNREMNHPKRTEDPYLSILRNWEQTYPKRNEGTADGHELMQNNKKRNRYLAMMKNRNRYDQKINEIAANHYDPYIKDDKRNRFLASMMKNHNKNEKRIGVDLAELDEPLYMDEEKRYIGLNGDVYDFPDKRFDWEELTQDWDNNQEVEP